MPESIIVGFTGTRKGMTLSQIDRLRAVLNLAFRDGIGEFHHGDCLGADEQSHDLVRRLWPRVQIVGHPCDLVKQRAFKDCDVTMHPLPPLVRNKKIVAASEYIVATPGEATEVLRSGTWSTIRHARKMNREITVIKP